MPTIAIFGTGLFQTGSNELRTTILPTKKDVVLATRMHRSGATMKTSGTNRSSDANEEACVDDPSISFCNSELMGANDPAANDDRNDEGQHYELDVAKKEDTWIGWIRVLIAVVLFGVAVTVCLLVYFAGRESETRSFEQDFSSLSKKLVMSFEENVQQRFQILNGFADGITSEANGSWPFVAPPHFSARAERVTRTANIMVLHLMPIVTRSNVDAWNDFSQANIYWRTESMARERGIALDQVNATDSMPFIFNPFVERGVRVPAEETNADGPFVPVWMSYPVSDFDITNLDLYSDWEHGAPIDKVIHTRSPVFEYSVDYLGHMEPDGRRKFIKGNKFVDYQDDPHATVFVPLFDGFDNDKKVMGVFRAMIYWRQYFDGLLPPGADGVAIILENTCNQTYTYRIDGSKSSWLGRGDLHESKYDYLEESTSINDVFSELDMDVSDLRAREEEFENDTNRDTLHYDCFYNIRVYPSQEFEGRYRSGKPLVQAAILAGLFLFTSSVFIFYDHMVERRQKLVLQSALQSGELVSSLFPAQVRERLFEEKTNLGSSQETKLRWRTSSVSDGVHDNELTANASLYPATTICFADIVGFTSWSAKRTPTQVFELLETIYECFDKVARKRRVFKIETIGDCYVAVTGLPEPQDDHALIMCKFANECLQKLQSLLVELSLSLGEDTKELDMRVGLHSGSCTAGVLRGEKSRFQLFGDTVNTAARMESNGAKGRIHVSRETAEALRVCGKGEWLTPREDKITAKGKGQLETFYVDVLSRGATESLSFTGLPVQQVQTLPADRAEI